MTHSQPLPRSVRSELGRLAQLAHGIADACIQIIHNGDDPPLAEGEACSLAEAARWGAHALAGEIERLRRRVARDGAPSDAAGVAGLASVADGAGAVLVLVRRLGARMPDRRHALFGLAAHAAEALAADAGALAASAWGASVLASLGPAAPEDAKRDGPGARGLGVLH